MFNVFCLALAAVHPVVDYRHDEAVEQGGGEQSAEDDLGHGALDLVAGQVAVDGQGNHGEGRGEGRHQNRVETVQGAAEDALADGEMLLGMQVVVAVDQQHAVAGRDAEEGDEADDGRDAQFAGGDNQGKYASNQGQRQVEQYDSALAGVLELHVQQQEDDHDAHQGGEQEGPAGGLLALGPVCH